jgi:hypothetical protein
MKHTQSIINVRKTKNKIRRIIKRLDAIGDAEKRLKKDGIHIDNISFSGCPVVFNSNTSS